MAQSPHYSDEQEIGLKDISRGIAKSFDKANNWFFRFLNFLRRNIIIVFVLLIAGAVLGYFADKSKSYETRMVVSPNFGSNDYLYGKINLIDSKIKTQDTAYLKSIGIEDPKSLRKISIAPVNDVYQFVRNSSQNFELLKLMVEDGNVKKVIEDPTTSKNFPHHQIVIVTSKPTTEQSLITPLMEFLNNSAFYAEVQREYVNNVKIKLEINQQIIDQIDAVLKSFSDATASGKSPNLVYYNENTQLNDVLKTKDELVRERGLMRIDLVSLDKIIKRNSLEMNIKSDSGLTGGMKVVLPLLFVFLFVIFSILRKGYKRQKAKFNAA